MFQTNNAEQMFCSNNFVRYLNTSKNGDVRYSPLNQLVGRKASEAVYELLKSWKCGRLEKNCRRRLKMMAGDPLITSFYYTAPSSGRKCIWSIFRPKTLVKLVNGEKLTVKVKDRQARRAANERSSPQTLMLKTLTLKIYDMGFRR